MTARLPEVVEVAGPGKYCAGVRDAAPPAPRPDGRRARRDRGRQAVIDALVDLIQEGHHLPAPEAIAERAGVSTSSVFRYFESLDELRDASTARVFERYASLFEVPDLGEGDLDARIGRLVGARATLYEAIAPLGRLVRGRSFAHEEMASTLSGVRQRLTGQCRAHFAPELSRTTPAHRDDLVGVVSTLTAFEAWDMARQELGRSSMQVQRSWRGALGALLGPLANG